MANMHEQAKRKGGRLPTNRVRKLSKFDTVKFSFPSYGVLKLRERKADSKLTEYIRNGKIVSGINTETTAIASVEYIIKPVYL